jgi:hypothetical protein
MEHKGREQEAKIDKKAIANPFPWVIFQM